MSEEGILKDVIAKSPNRRGFVRKLGLASAALGAVAASPKIISAAPAAGGPSDTDILNFALNLEYLEAEFYNIATSGKSIDQLGVDISGTGTIGVSTGGYPVTFTSTAVQAMAVELAANELTHVDLIRSTLFSLGVGPVARPAINLNALGLGFASESDFLVLARVFEEIGVTAYGGAAPLISNSAVLAAAARILAVEAEHVGSIRWILAARGITVAALDGADIIPPPAGTKYFSTNSQALTAIRTPAQVLYLAYGGASLAKGAFFPGGVNGNINMSASAAAVIDGATFTASPNPIHVSVRGTPGVTTLTWSAPAAMGTVEIHVGSPSGPLFAIGANSGSATTQAWVVDGTMFYLQDSTMPLTLVGTLAMVVAHVVTP